MEIGMVQIMASFGLQNVTDQQVYDEEVRQAVLADQLDFDHRLGRRAPFRGLFVLPGQFRLSRAYRGADAGASASPPARSSCPGTPSRCGLPKKQRCWTPFPTAALFSVSAAACPAASSASSALPWMNPATASTKWRR